MKRIVCEDDALSSCYHLMIVLESYFSLYQTKLKRTFV
nr:MAG TPA: hypothetical protein [Caudoviricetes sp.]